jgi:hypothetical protein
MSEANLRRGWESGQIEKSDAAISVTRTSYRGIQKANLTFGVPYGPMGATCDPAAAVELA